MIRPIESSDAAALLTYFQRLVQQDPERVERPSDVSRLSLADEVAWVENRQIGGTHPGLFAMCCEVEEAIVAVGEIERKERWVERHVGEIRFGVLPTHADHAISLVMQLIETSRSIGIDTLVYFHLATQALGLATVRATGFVEMGRIRRYYRRAGAPVDRVYFVRYDSPHVSEEFASSRGTSG